MRFTPNAGQLIRSAQEEAKHLHHRVVEPEHILLGLLALNKGIGFEILVRSKVDIEKLRQRTERNLRLEVGGPLLGEIPFTPDAKSILEYSVEEAKSLSDNFVGTEHLMLGLLRFERTMRILLETGQTPESCRRLIEETRFQRRRHETRESPSTIEWFFQNEITSINLHPMVTGLLMIHSPKPEGGFRKVLLILLANGADFASVHGELANILVGFEKFNVEYKLPGKRPLMWFAGKWQEDRSIEETLVY